MNTVRMFYRDKDNTLNGYVFSDRAHARQWLSQKFVDLSEITLQEVSLGELRRCRMCDGTGYHLSVKATGDKMPAKNWMDREGVKL